MLHEPSRGIFVEFVRQNAKRILEIGPFTNPVCKGENVKYFDVMSKEKLIERASFLKRPVYDAVHIDFISPVGDLSVVRESFDACVSCHAIEHQPDLIKHLNDIEKALDINGKYFIIIPDKRYCFDYFIKESTIADVLEARGRKVHTLKSVIEHRALTTHNDVQRHWLGDHGAPRYVTDPSSVNSALAEYDRASGGYIDVHAWQFNPNSFRGIVVMLNSLGLTRMKVDRIFQTSYGSNEFYAILSLG